MPDIPTPSGNATQTKDTDIFSLLSGAYSSRSLGGTGGTDLFKSMVPLFSVLLLLSFISLGIKSLSNQVMIYVIILLLSILIAYSVIKKQSFGESDDFIVINVTGKDMQLIDNNTGVKRPLNNGSIITANTTTESLYISNITSITNDNCDLCVVITKITYTSDACTMDVIVGSLDTPSENAKHGVTFIGETGEGGNSFRKSCPEQLPPKPEPPPEYKPPTINNPYDFTTEPEKYNNYFSSDEYWNKIKGYHTEYQNKLDEYFRLYDERNNMENKYSQIMYNFTNDDILFRWYRIVPDNTRPEGAQLIVIPELGNVVMSKGGGYFKLNQSTMSKEYNGEYVVLFFDDYLKMLNLKFNTSNKKGIMITGYTDNKLTIKKIFPLISVENNKNNK
jgi:hypothetical protein